MKKIKFKQIATIILKNLLTLVCGAVLGVLLFFICLEPMLYLTMPKNINGLGIIAVIPVLIIIYSILFAVGGGVLGLFVYNSILLLKRLKNNLPK